jgi:hypothetical protein
VKVVGVFSCAASLGRKKKAKGRKYIDEHARKSISLVKKKKMYKSNCPSKALLII